MSPTNKRSLTWTTTRPTMASRPTSKLSIKTPIRDVKSSRDFDLIAINGAPVTSSNEFDFSWIPPPESTRSSRLYDLETTDARDIERDEADQDPAG